MMLKWNASSYYFPSQNRFVPSSGSFPRQLQQPQQTLNGYRSSNTGFSPAPAPGSYQEQLLFIANENGNNNGHNKQSSNSPFTSSFGGNSQFAKPNRQSDYYDISPRPFGVPVSGVGGGATSATPSNGFTRSKAIRGNGANSLGSSLGSSSGSSLNGFQPQTQRVNVPHQQTQFLAHFSEPAAAAVNEKRLSSSSAALRPFGSGGFSPSSTRTRTQAPPADEATPQAVAAATPYRVRGRYQASTTTGSSTPSTTTASSAEQAVSSKRFNRFGSNRAAAKTTSSTASSAVTQNASSERPSFGRKAPNPRRPVFISREINEPVSVVSKRPFNYNSANARLKLPRPTSSTTSTTESLDEQEDEEGEEQYDQELPENDHEEPSSLEKLPLQEEAITPITIAKTEGGLGVSQEHTSEALSEDTVTSNEDGLDRSTSGSTGTSTEESQTDSSETSDFSEETTLPNVAHEYEYVEEKDKEKEKEKATTALPKQSESTEEHHTESEAETTESPGEGISTTTQSTTSKQQAPETQKEKEIQTTSKQEEESEYDDEEGEEGDEEYDYDEEEEGEQEEQHNDATTESENESTPSKEHKFDDGREIISVVTTKSVVNGSTAFPAPVTPSSLATTLADSQPAPQPEQEEERTEVPRVETVEATTPVPSEPANVTESYVVVASIQTSRSINGARFLPFPAIEQEETKQTLSELERKVHSKQQQKQLDLNESSEEPSTTTASTSSVSVPVQSSTERSLPAQGASTESIIDKLDRVQSELSSGVLSGKYPIISQMDASTPASTMSTGSGRFVPNIRKFQPRTTAAPSTTSSGGGAKLKVQHFDEAEMDELASLLPIGFKPKFGYKNRKITTTTTTTTTTEASPVEEDQEKSRKPARNSTISRSFKNGVVAVQDVALAGLLPKGYKPPRTTTSTSTTTTTKSPALESLFSDFDDSLAALLPKDYKLNSNSTTSKPAIALVDDISKFLPPGFSPPTTSTTQRSPAVAVPFDDLSSFLPPGYKPPKEQAQEPKLPIKITPLKVDDLSSLLPPGFKLNDTLKANPSEEDDLLASLLPPGYKSKTAPHPASTTTTTSKPKSTVASPTSVVSSTEATGGLKVVFPKGFHKRLGSHRLTTPHTPIDGAVDAGASSSSSPSLVIRKGPPMRATTEFTGWPTPPTTPLSIDKLNAQTINFEDLLTAASSSTTTTTSTSTTTTTTTTPRPTKPGHCTADCDLEATIKIIEGVAWKPELLDHNTVEWKNLAHELEAQLNEVYSNAAQLSKWYKKVRIDSFSKGSVLVDYYVELANITEDVDTLEIKQLFHDALSRPTMSVLPDKDAQENETDSESSVQPQEEQLVKASYQMGKFTIDPVATEFSVIAKNLHTNLENTEDDLPIPQWAIVVIVIGVGSLVFVVIFGVTVLLNRQKRAKKTPIPLTNDMLNELKVNHMGGADNYGVDDFYNIDDPWNDTKQPIKPKRFTNSMHGSNSSNIYDSWRSTRHAQNSGDYFYDQQPSYSQKGDSLKRPHLGHHHQHQPYAGHQQQQQPQGYGHGHQYPDAFADAHQMYSYNNHASRTRYARDYDPDF
ncbi:hypothetical protein ACLKA6_014831 [Drosophila palustris]